MLGKFINNKEDSLTVAVLGHLLHLPCELFWQILMTACIDSKLPNIAGELKSVEYWPRWNPEGTNNIRYVEPDVCIRFEGFDLIIEAKRWDSAMQYEHQWKSELRTYYNEFHEEKKPVYILALGGVVNRFTEQITIDIPNNGTYKCDVVKCTWESLLHQCQNIFNEVSNHRFASSQIKAQERILSDIIDLFEVFGFSTGCWYEDFDFDINSLDNVEQSQNVFRRLRWNFVGRWYADFNLEQYSLCGTEDSQDLFRNLHGRYQDE